MDDTWEDADMPSLIVYLYGETTVSNSHLNLMLDRRRGADLLRIFPLIGMHSTIREGISAASKRIAVGVSNGWVGYGCVFNMFPDLFSLFHFKTMWNSYLYDLVYVKLC